MSRKEEEHGWVFFNLLFQRLMGISNIFTGGRWGEVGECLMSQTENSPQCCLVLAGIINVNHKQMSLPSNRKVGFVQNSLSIILVPKNHLDGTKNGSLYKENSAQG
ncbi:hypothetical protein D3C85_642590 [compost metagenome]